MSGPDAAPILHELIHRCGVDIGDMVGTTAAAVAERIDTTIRTAFAHGVAEGMELCAQASELYALAIDQQFSDATAVSAYIRQLRDQIRMSALSVEITS